MFKFAYDTLTSWVGKEKGSHDLSRNSLFFLARLERFELPTYGFVVRQKKYLSVLRPIFVFHFFILKQYIA